MRHLFALTLLALVLTGVTILIGWGCTPWHPALQPSTPIPAPSPFVRALLTPLPISWRVPVVRISRGWPGGIVIVEAYDSPFTCHGMAWTPRDKNIPVGGQVTFSPTGIPCADQNAEIWATTLPPAYGLNDVTCAPSFVGKTFSVLTTTPTDTDCLWKGDPLGGYDVQYNLVKPGDFVRVLHRPFTDADRREYQKVGAIKADGTSP